MGSSLLAQTINNPLLGNLGTMNGSTFIGNLIPALISILLMVGSIVFVFMLLWGGIEWITAGGDKGKVEAARDRVTNALIGIFIMFSIFAIISLVQFFFGIKLTTFDLSQLRVGAVPPPVPPAPLPCVAAGNPCPALPQTCCGSCLYATLTCQ